MENLVLFIEKEKFIRNLMDELFKVKATKIYTVETILNNEYLIGDLKPTIIIFDVKTIGDNLNSIKGHAGVKYIGIGDPDDEEKVRGEVDKFILKPLQVKNLYEQIFSVLN